MRLHHLALAVAGVAVGVSSAVAQGLDRDQTSQAISDVRYTVTYNRAMAERDVIHVAMEFTVAEDEPIVLSLPAWTPGSYELDNFGRYVHRFRAWADGRALKVDKLDPDTWMLTPALQTDIMVEFEFGSDTLDTGMAFTAPDFAFFNGTNLFLYAEGLPLDSAVSVSINTEPDWKVATGLRRGEAGSYLADDYHELVDMPTFVGVFDLDSAQVDGRWYRLATYPEGVVSPDQRAVLWDQIQLMMPPMAAVFGETPWEDYTILLAFDDQYPGGSALEHSSSHLGIFNTQFIGTPVLASVIAHETFHAWNVKRLRPEELVPYLYDRPQPTEMLWVSEGITDYYADLALVRGGIIDAQGFYRTTAGKIDAVESSPPVSLEDASVSTWIDPTDGSSFIYYPKGSAAGLLLDILIRDASGNTNSLDDVMLDLYRRTYQNGRGFNHIDLWRSIGRASNSKSFADFYAAYIDRADPYPWNEVLSLAGLSLEVDTLHIPRMGVSTSQVDSAGALIVNVSPGSSAAGAGLLAGDYLIRAGTVAVNGPDFGQAFRDTYGTSSDGAPLEYVVRRGSDVLTLAGNLRLAEQVDYLVVEDPDADDLALAIRQGILTGN